LLRGLRLAPLSRHQLALSGDAVLRAGTRVGRDAHRLRGRVAGGRDRRSRGSLLALRQLVTATDATPPKALRLAALLWSGEPGGAERFTFELCRTMRETGADVRILFVT